jgi:hypothetical protein
MTDKQWIPSGAVISVWQNPIGDETTIFWFIFQPQIYYHCIKMLLGPFLTVRDFANFSVDMGSP